MRRAGFAITCLEETVCEIAQIAHLPKIAPIFRPQRERQRAPVPFAPAGFFFPSRGRNPAPDAARQGKERRRGGRRVKPAMLAEKMWHTTGRAETARRFAWRSEEVQAGERAGQRQDCGVVSPRRFGFVREVPDEVRLALEVEGHPPHPRAATHDTPLCRELPRRGPLFCWFIALLQTRKLARRLSSVSPLA